ncbi:MAG: hypothetical protein ACTSQ3_06215 [Candidatus Heimdallarchaeota archaeon]
MHNWAPTLHEGAEGESCLLEVPGIDILWIKTQLKAWDETQQNSRLYD